MQQQAGAESAEIVISPSCWYSAIDFKELWNYRELLYFLAWRDIKVKYKQSVLGVAWVLFRPLMSMMVFSVLFGKYAKIPSDGAPYPLFVFLGLLPWLYVSTAIGGCTTSVVGSSNLISKVYFPRLIIPISVSLAGLLDLLVSLLVLAGLVAYYGISISWGVLAVPLLMAMLFFTVLGPGMLFGALNVRFRDVGQIIQYLLQLLMFITPVIYPVSLIPERYRYLVYLNPVAGPIEAFRAVVLPSAKINWPGLCISGTVTAVLLLVGMYYFKSVERTFVDII